MSKSTILAACTALLFAAGCDRGSARNDTLVDGAVDAPPVAEGVGAPAGPNMPDASMTPPAAGNNPGLVPGLGPTVAVATGPEYGAYLANSAGSALYMLEGDTDGSACVGECTVAWPPVLVPANELPTAAAGIPGAMVSTVIRPDGSRQLSYNGRPMYRYAADGGVGVINGHGVRDQYGHWYLMSPQGEPLPVPQR